MPHAMMPWVRNGRLLNGADKGIVVDSPQWFAWLASVTSFCYYSQHSWVRLTVRYEKRGARFYWYAYSRIDSKLHNAYLGNSATLTHSLLEETCQQIYRKAKEWRGKANNNSYTFVTDHS